MLGDPPDHSGGQPSKPARHQGDNDMNCKHENTTSGEHYGFTGPVAVHPYTSENRAAHGGVTYDETCQDCGRTRAVNATTYSQIHVQTRNCSDVYPFRADLTADSLSELLGWSPAASFLREIVAVLKSGKGVQVFTSKFRVQGNNGIAYIFLPVPVGLPTGTVPPVTEIVHYNQRPDGAVEGGAL